MPPLRHQQFAAPLFADVTLKGPSGIHAVRVIVDTGAATTIIPPKVAAEIGCDPARSKKRITILTASSEEYLPLVTIPLVICLGCRLRNFSVACHDLPPQSTVDGLLGLDFLRHVPAFQQFHREILHLTQE